MVSDFRGERDWRPQLVDLAGHHEVLAVEIRDPREEALVDVGEVLVFRPGERPAPSGRHERRRASRTVRRRGGAGAARGRGRARNGTCVPRRALDRAVTGFATSPPTWRGDGELRDPDRASRPARRADRHRVADDRRAPTKITERAIRDAGARRVSGAGAPPHPALVALCPRTLRALGAHRRRCTTTCDAVRSRKTGDGRAGDRHVAFDVGHRREAVAPRCGARVRAGVPGRRAVELLRRPRLVLVARSVVLPPTTDRDAGTRGARADQARRRDGARRRDRRSVEPRASGESAAAGQGDEIPATVVLLSDGEQTSGSDSPWPRRTRPPTGSTVNTVALGTRRGGRRRAAPRRAQGTRHGDARHEDAARGGPHDRRALHCRPDRQAARSRSTAISAARSAGSERNVR